MILSGFRHLLWRDPPDPLALNFLWCDLHVHQDVHQGSQLCRSIPAIQIHGGVSLYKSPALSFRYCILPGNPVLHLTQNIIGSGIQDAADLQNFAPL